MDKAKGLSEGRRVGGSGGRSPPEPPRKNEKPKRKKEKREKPQRKPSLKFSKGEKVDKCRNAEIKGEKENMLNAEPTLC